MEPITYEALAKHIEQMDMHHFDAAKYIYQKPRNAGKSASLAALYGTEQIKMPKINNSWGKSYNTLVVDEYIKGEFMTEGENTTPHSERKRNFGSNRVQVAGLDMRGTLEINDEDMILRVELPGIARERIEVRQIDNILRIRVKPESEEFDIINQRTPQAKELQLIMTPNELVGTVKLDLGVLTVQLDRGREVRDFNVEVS